MLFVIDTARRNVVENTGGPFAAGVFEMHTGRLISLGVNLVTTEKLSVLHAEMVALMIAQRNFGTYDLGVTGTAFHELFTSAEPCAMCFGAIPGLAYAAW
jgi:tRNA(Arg) A34 adenosine deaminase TadA